MVPSPAPQRLARTGTATGKRGPTAPLTRESIADKALELAERHGTAALSLRRLGVELGVDATAFYRHFRDKDELVLAMFDQVIGLQVTRIRALDPALDWRERLRDLAVSSWETARQHPAIFSLAFARITGGPAEREVVEFIVSTLAGTGLAPDQVVLHYRAFTDAQLSLCGMTAAIGSLEDSVREKDASAWTRIYAVLPQGEYPAARAHAAELAAVTDEAIYLTVIDAVLQNIQAAIERVNAR